MLLGQLLLGKEALKMFKESKYYLVAAGNLMIFYCDQSEGVHDLLFRQIVEIAVYNVLLLLFPNFT